MQVDTESAEQLLRSAAEAERTGEASRAAELLLQALEAAGADAEALLAIAEAQMRLKRPRLALQAFERAAHAAPHNATVFFRRGQFFAQTRQHAASVKNFERAVQLEPRRFDILMGYGAALSADNQIPKSLEVFLAARKLNPSHTGVLSNCGWLLCQLQRYDESLKCLDRALDIEPGHAGARWNRALCLLTMGRFEDGFADYEARMTINDARYERLRKYEAPLWRKGEPVAGKRVFLYTDQGHGDTLQFIRLARNLMRMDAEVIVEVQAPLVELCTTMHPDLRVIAQGATPPAFDLFCPMPSLPHRLGLTVETIPARVPYLVAEPSLASAWRGKLGKLTGRMKIGVTWAGNPQHFNDANRSIALERLLPVLETRGVSFVSLQKELRPGDDDLLSDVPIFDQTKSLHSFNDTAALVSQLDLVISVDTSVAHLAGALGKPVWILLPYAVDFRWLAGRADSPWYPTARLFRQPKFGDWESPIAQVRAGLAAALR